MTLQFPVLKDLILMNYIKSLLQYLGWLLPSSVRSKIIYLISAKKLYFNDDPAQFGEGRLLVDFLKVKGKTTGRYMDIGCYHPIYLSNTYFLHQMGWKGIVVDTRYEKLKEMIKYRGNKVEVLCSAVVPNNHSSQSIDMYFFKKIWSEIDTSSYEEACNKRAETKYSFYHKKIPAIHSSELDLSTVDVLNIDIEGLDYVVLKDLSIQNLPDTILFESTVGDLRGLQLLKNMDYEVIFEAGKTTCMSKL
jgi:hypothetical protein